MITIKNSIILGIMFPFLMSCSAKYTLKLTSPKTIKINQELNMSVSEKNNQKIDSVLYYLDGKRLPTNTKLNISEKKLGKHALSATVFYGDKQKKLTNTIYFMNSKSPDIYKYEILKEYPHDKNAFTQGLEYHNGILYESTGQYGKSSLRKVDLNTGEVLKKVTIPKEFFGEGMTIYNDKIYVLTWQSKKGFIYNLETFEKEGEFNYNKSKEGWGLTHHADKLIKTDGTERLWFLDPNTLAEVSYIEAYTDKRKVDNLNEVEYINGKIYANKWQKNSILIINPISGAIEGIVNLKGLQTKAGQEGDNYVLNGIAYDAENNRLFVTGKDWGKLFEIKLIKE